MCFAAWEAIDAAIPLLRANAPLGRGGSGASAPPELPPAVARSLNLTLRAVAEAAHALAPVPGATQGDPQAYYAALLLAARAAALGPPHQAAAVLPGPLLDRLASAALDEVVAAAMPELRQAALPVLAVARPGVSAALAAAARAEEAAAAADQEIRTGAGEETLCASHNPKKRSLSSLSNLSAFCLRTECSVSAAPRADNTLTPASFRVSSPLVPQGITTHLTRPPEVAPPGQRRPCPASAQD